MTAMDGGERLDEGPAALNSVLERPHADGPARSLEQIFPLRGDAGRAHLMQETWRAFTDGMAGRVAAAFDGGRSPAEVAYAIGEVVHNYFRTRGVTLTSYELRRLVAELLARRQRGLRLPASGPLVQFASEPSTGTASWTGADPAPPPPVGDAAFAGPPSPLVTVTPREMADIVAKVRARLVGDPFSMPRKVVVDVVASVLDDVAPEGRGRLMRLALGELCGLGPIERLWADRSIRAVFVNGPDALYVERAGVIEPSQERFRDRAHLAEIISRLAKPGVSPAVAISLRDGSEGVVLFPPAAPAGPVLALRRGEPGEATLERLVSAGRLDRRMADLLRIAVRSRLSVLVVGPEKAGKTALLAALTRDRGDARVVTVAPHREFRWKSAAKVELVASPQVSLATLLATGLQLRPDLLVVDSLQPSDAAALGKLLSGKACGIVAAGEAPAVAGVPRQSVDLLVSVGRLRGLSVVTSMEDATGVQLFAYQKDGGFQRRVNTPSFARTVHEAGYGEALSSVFH
ncbi:MAG: CpaF family protein [Rhodospirillales bacterium]|nr:CpaF family protein [Rhodospirillales bacterium]